MSGSFQKKTTNIFLTIFIGFIVISFMFTGYETMRGTPDTVAVVGDQNVTFREYQSEFDRQLQFYSQFVLGGQTLSSKQIKDFNIKQNALKSLVNGRLSTTLGHKLGVVVPSEEIRATIKQQEFFQTNGSFDLEKYKAILAANQLQPTDYEATVERELTASKTNALLGTYPVSNKFLSDIQEFKAQKRTGTIVRISKDDVGAMMSVSKSEIDAYLSDKTNEDRVRSIFGERKATLDRQDSVVASHILLRAKEGESDAALKKRIDAIAAGTTAKNFAQMAAKHTEEPGGKERKGSLGSFGRGRMVPAFEEVAFSLPVGKVSAPVKTDFGYHLILVESKVAAKEASFDDHKVALASELIRKQKSEEVAAYVEDVAKQVEAALGSKSKLESLKAKWKLNLETDIEINRYEGAKGSIFLETAQISKLFGHEAEAIDRFDSAAYITYVTSKPAAKTASTDNKNDLEQEAKSMKLAYSNKMRQDMLTKLGDDVSVRVYDNRIP